MSEKLICPECGVSISNKDALEKHQGRSRCIITSTHTKLHAQGFDRLRENFPSIASVMRDQLFKAPAFMSSSGLREAWWGPSWATKICHLTKHASTDGTHAALHVAQQTKKKERDLLLATLSAIKGEGTKTDVALSVIVSSFGPCCGRAERWLRKLDRQAKERA